MKFRGITISGAFSAKLSYFSILIVFMAMLLNDVVIVFDLTSSNDANSQTIFVVTAM